MCGIIAYLGSEQVSPILVKGLQRMEYRGYDSSGVAIIDKAGKMMVCKKQGKVKNLENELGARHPEGTLGIAHTRWATHGKPSDVNAHPHTNEDNTLAVVHNGIIENHASLRKRLMAEGYVFRSETDTEILAMLIHHVMSIHTDLTLVEAVTLALTQVRGAYGIAVIDERYPDILVGARRGSPLILGVSDTGLLLASDATAVVGETTQVVYLHEQDVVTCTRDPINQTYDFEITNVRGDVTLMTPEERDRAGTESDSESERGSRADSMASVDSVSINSGPPKPPQPSRLDKSIRRSLGRRIPKTVVREMHKLTMSLDVIEKGGYDHFMLKEIMEQPTVLQDCMRGRVNAVTGEVKLHGLEPVMDKLINAKRIIICACGTSWHSALVGEYLIESLARVPVEVEYASEFRYRNPVIFPEDIVMVISQSGETADTLEALKIAKKAGATVLGFVNVVGSSIARETDGGAYLHVGPEIGVASTKAFTGQVLMLEMFAIMLGARRGLLSKEQQISHTQALTQIPQMIKAVLHEDNLEKLQGVAKSFRYAHNFLYLGRGFNFPVALEGALKLKEISYIHAEGYPAAEMKHGPIALIDRMMPVVIIASRNDPMYEKVKSGIEEVVARDGVVIVITDEGNDELERLAECVIHVPVTEDFLSPLLNVIPLQLLSYYIAKLRGCEIDQPRNLAKSVTVE